MPTKVRSLRDIRLISLHGHTAIIKADEITTIADELVEDAMAAGCVVVGHEEAPAEEPVTEASEPEEPEGDLLRDAIIKVVTRGDAEDFRADNTPKVGAIRAELPEDFRVSAADVLSKYIELQETMELSGD